MVSEELRRYKAKQIRYQNAIVKDLNIEKIKNDVFDIGSECADVQWYVDTDEDSLIDALDGDEDEAYEFKMMFADLSAECEQMSNDLENEYVPEFFDDFFTAISAGDTEGGYLGYDRYEGDYFGISGYLEGWAESESQKRIERLTKKEIIEASHQCFAIASAYMGIRYRYQSLKATMDILKSQNKEYLQTISNINLLYEKAVEMAFGNSSKSTKEFEKLLEAIPQEAWIQ